MRKGSLPSSIPLGGREFRLSFDLSMSENYGEFDGDAGKISLQKSMAKPGKLKVAESTVAHELIHAALWQSGLHWRLDEGEEESLVRMLEHLFIPAHRSLVLACSPCSCAEPSE